MILLIGICVLGIAALLGVLGVATNGGSTHQIQGDFALFGQHITGLSTGQLFLFGIIVGLVAALGLSILRGLFARGMASRDLQKELKRVRADFDRVQTELVAEKARNQSMTTQVTPPSEQTPSL